MDKEIEKYLNDLDNLLETGHFQNVSIKDYTFNHKDLNLKEFVQKGRELIRESLHKETKKEVPSIIDCQNEADKRYINAVFGNDRNLFLEGAIWGSNNE